MNEYSVATRRLKACTINDPVLEQYLRNEDHNIYGNSGCNGAAVNRITFTIKEFLLVLSVVLWSLQKFTLLLWSLEGVVKLKYCVGRKTCESN
jgi:hypothetical protein